jgi:hypothetical protein
MNEEHNMTLRDRWKSYCDKYQLFTNENYADNMPYFLQQEKAFEFFLAQFDAMLAEDIEKMKDRVNFGDIRYNSGIKSAMSILEARRLALKSNV